MVEHETGARRAATRRFWGRALIAVMALTTGLVAGGERPAAAADELVITPGYGGYAQPGRPFPVTVAVTADGLFHGELRVSSAFGQVVASERDLEVAGGTTHELTIVASSPPWEAPTIRVDLVADDGTVVAGETVRLEAPTRTELVGVLPGVAPRDDVPESTSLPVDGDALLFAVDPAQLALGWGVIAPLDVVAVSADDLRELDDSAAHALTAWINQGGRLLVDEAPGSDLPVLPRSWVPSGAAPRPAGMGEVVFTDGAARSGDWASILDPSPTGSQYEDGPIAEVGSMFGFEPLSWSLGRDAGFDLPGVGMMLLLLGVYVAAAGPLTWFALRRLRRPGLAWLVIPVVSVVFATSLWLLGSSVRRGVQTVHGTVVEVGAAGSVVSTYELLNSRSGGEVSIPILDGWWSASSFFEQETPPAATIDHGDGDDAELRAEIDAGGFVVLGASGPAPEFDDAVVVTATSSEDGTVTGTVTSALEVDLEEVVVFVDQAGESIGELPAGATVEFEVSSAPADSTRGEPIEFTVWRRALPPGWAGPPQGRYDPGVVNLSLWSGWTYTRAANARQVGSVVVAGWTDALASPVDADVETGSTLVVARSQIVPDGDVLTDVASTRRVVRGPQELGPGFQDFQVWGGGAMLAFTLPDGVERDDLVLAIPRAQRRVELLVDGEWRRVDIASETADVVSLPRGAIDARGRVYVKVMLSFEQGVRWRDLAVRSARPDDEVGQIRWADGAEAGA